MKHVITFLVLAVLATSAPCSNSKSIDTLRLYEHVILNNVQGFLQYAGLHYGIEIYALSSDFGSAMPSQDFRLYVKQGNAYIDLMSLPMLSHKGYRCIVQKDIMSVYVTKGIERAFDEKNPLIVINLKKIIEANADFELPKK